MLTFVTFCILLLVGLKETRTLSLIKCLHSWWTIDGLHSESKGKAERLKCSPVQFAVDWQDSRVAQEGESHGGDGVGTLQHTSIKVQPSLTNYQLTLLHRSKGAGGSRYGLCGSNYHLCCRVQWWTVQVCTFLIQCAEITIINYFFQCDFWEFPTKLS